MANDEIITNQKSGFRPVHSTITVLLEASDSLAFNVDLGNANAVVFLPLKKAFDAVDHEAKLSLYGRKESAYDWFSPIEIIVPRNMSFMVCFSKPVPLVVGSFRELS